MVDGVGREVDEWCGPSWFVVLVMVELFHGEGGTGGMDMLVVHTIADGAAAAVMESEAGGAVEVEEDV